MTGVKVSVGIENGAAVEKDLAALARSTGDLKPLFGSIGEYVLQTIDQRFRDEVDPQGRKWQQVTAATRKRKRHPKILTESHRLARSYAYQASSSHLEVGSNDVRAATHHYGRGNIPARPALGVSDDDRDEILELGKEHLIMSLKSARGSAV